MKAYHGTVYWKLADILDGKSKWFPGLFVTDTPERAQLYADAQASGSVDTKVRKCDGSAVVEIDTVEQLNYTKRPANHGSLDISEAVTTAWKVTSVTVYVNAYSAEHGTMAVDGKHVNAMSFLREKLGNKLQIVIK